MELHLGPDHYRRFPMKTAPLAFGEYRDQWCNQTDLSLQAYESVMLFRTPFSLF